MPSVLDRALAKFEAEPPPLPPEPKPEPGTMRVVGEAIRRVETKDRIAKRWHERFLEEKEILAGAKGKPDPRQLQRLQQLRSQRQPTTDEREIAAAAEQVGPFVMKNPHVRPAAIAERLAPLTPSLFPEERMAVAKSMLHEAQPKDKELWDTAGKIARGHLTPQEFEALAEKLKPGGDRWNLLPAYIARNVLGEESIRGKKERFEETVGRATLAIGRDLRTMLATTAPGLDAKRIKLQNELEEFRAKGFDPPHGAGPFPDWVPRKKAEIPGMAKAQDIARYKKIRQELREHDRRVQKTAVLRQRIEEALEAGDPIAGKGLLEKAWLASASVAPRMAVGAALSSVSPAAGKAFWTASEGTELLADLVEMDIEPDQARAYAALGGFVSGAILEDRRTARIVSGAARGFRRAAGIAGKQVARGTSRAALRRGAMRHVMAELARRVPAGVGSLMVETGKESGVEGLQALARLVGKTGAAMEAGKLDRIDWDREAGAVVDEVVGALYAFPGLLLPGKLMGGIGATREAAASALRGAEVKARVLGAATNPEALRQLMIARPELREMLGAESLSRKDANRLASAFLTVALRAKGHDLAQDVDVRLSTRKADRAAILEALSGVEVKADAESTGEVAEEIGPEAGAEGEAAPEVRVREPGDAEVPAEEAEETVVQPVVAEEAPEAPVEVEADAQPGGAGAAVQVGVTDGGNIVTLNDAAAMALDEIESVDDQADYIRGLRARMDESSISDILEKFEVRAPQKARALLERLGRAPGQFGAHNRLVTTEEAEAIKADLRKRLGPTEPGAMFKPLQAVPQLAKLGLYYFEGGLRTFAEWSRTLIQELHLPENKETEQALKKAWRRMIGGRAKILGREQAMKKVARSFGGEKQVRDFIEDQLLLWEKGEPSDVSPAKFVRWVKAQTQAQERTKAKEASQRARESGQRRGEYLGAVAKQTDDKTLMEWAKEYLPEREHKMIAAVLERIIKSRTPRQRDKVIDGINALVEKHNRAVAVRGLRDAISGAKRQRLLTEHREQLDALLEGVALSVPSPKSVDRALQVLSESKTALEYEGPRQALVERAVDTLRRLRAVERMRDMTSDQIRDLTAAVGLIAAADRAWKEAHGQGRYAAAKAAIDGAAEEARERLGEKYDDKPGERPVSPAANAVLQMLGLDQLSYETMLDRIVGLHGTAYQHLMRDLQDAQDDLIAALTRESEEFRAGLEKIGLTLKDLEKWSDTVAGKPGGAETVPVSLPGGRRLLLTRGQRVELLLHARDGGTLEQILDEDSEGVQVEGAQNPRKLSAADLRAIKASASRQELALADLISSRINGTMREQVRATWREQHGFDLPVREGYYPRRRQRYETDSQKLLAELENQMLDNMGIFKSRKTSTAPIIVGDALDTYFRHTAKAYNYAHKALAVENALRIVGSKQFQTAVKKGLKHGRAYLDKLRDTIRDYTGLETAPSEAADRALGGFIRRFHVAKLGLKPTIMLYQLTSFLTAMLEIHPKYMLRAGLQFGSRETLAEMKQYGPGLYSRVAGGNGHNILSPGASRAGLRQFLGAKEGGLFERLGMWGIGKMDAQVIYRIWDAAKREAADQGLEGEDMLRAAAVRAREITNRTQPTWDPLTISQLQRYGKKNRFFRLAVMYSSMRSKLLNMAVRAVLELKHSNRTAGDWARFGAKFSAATWVNAMVLAVINTGYYWLLDPPDDDEEKQRQARYFCVGMLNRLFGTWLLGGDALSAAATAIEAGAVGLPEWFAEPREGAVLSTTADAAAVLYHLTKAATQQGEYYTRGKRAYTSKAGHSLSKGLERAVRLSGLGLKVPVEGIMDAGKRIYKRIDRD